MPSAEVRTVAVVVVVEVPVAEVVASSSAWVLQVLSSSKSVL